MWSSKFQLGIWDAVSAKFQESSACWQIGWIVIKAPATLRTWNRHHLAVHKVTRSVLRRGCTCQFFPFNHIVHAEINTYFCRVGFGSDVTKNVFIGGPLSRLFFNSLSLYATQFLLQLHHLVVCVSAQTIRLGLQEYPLWVTCLSVLVPVWAQCMLYVFPNCNHIAKYKHKIEVVMAISQHNNSAGGVMLLFILNKLLSESRDIIQWSGVRENTGVNILLLPISIICLL